jgi:hypothetical protein
MQPSCPLTAHPNNCNFDSRQLNQPQNSMAVAGSTNSAIPTTTDNTILYTHMATSKVWPLHRTGSTDRNSLPAFPPRQLHSPSSTPDNFNSKPGKPLCNTTHGLASTEYRAVRQDQQAGAAPILHSAHKNGTLTIHASTTPPLLQHPCTAFRLAVLHTHTYYITCMTHTTTPHSQ